MSRVLRGLGALTLLLVGLIGAPLALVGLGGDPIPDTFSWASLGAALLRPDDGTILVRLIALIGWAAWLVFAVSVFVELVGVLSRNRIRIRLPGLAGPQRLAAGLIIAVIGLTSTAPLGHAVPPAPAVATPAVSIPASGPNENAPRAYEDERHADRRTVAAAAPATDPNTHRHTVRAGDDLWSLAERFYGNGRDWRRIAEANRRLLSGGPDRLTPGTVLLIPAVRPESVADQRLVTVREGDTLSAIAERELGSAERWPAVFRLNRAELSDPDELAVGTRLRLPAAHPRTSKPQVPQPDPEATASTSVSPADATPPPTRPGPGRRPNDPGATPVNSSPAGPTPAPDPSPAPDSKAAPRPPAEDRFDASSMIDVALPLAGVGSLLAAGLLTGLAWRRRIQLQGRPVGRRIIPAPPQTVPVEVGLGARQRPLSLRTLDRALRAVAAHSRATGTMPPTLQFAAVADDHLELMVDGSNDDPPPGFTRDGPRWRLAAVDVQKLDGVVGLGDALRPWPALVGLGHDDQDRQILLNLEAAGRLGIALPTERATSMLAAMAVELSFSPWAEEMNLTLVGSSPGLPEALGRHNITRTEDLDDLLDRLEHRAIAQREHPPATSLGAYRIDPDLADPWAPEIVLINVALSTAQAERLGAVIDADPPVSIAAVVIGPVSGRWNLRSWDDGRVRLEPAGLELYPQLLEPPVYDAVIDLLEATGNERTEPAGWWAQAEAPPDRPPDNVTYLGRRYADASRSDDDQEVIMEPPTSIRAGVDHPTLLLLGPVELLGAAGPVPPRAGKQCLEYCGWLLERPGTTAMQMGTALQVAEGTRRSNMSRLRTWLGSDPTGAPYLPDAYSGRIVLHPSVSSDWQRLQILTAVGINRASDGTLRAALELVRGAPLADAAPGQWHWAESMRIDMASMIRDLGVELADRALAAGDLDQARWAAARALAAAPGDELLLCARIRTEHRAGNAAETERLSLALSAQARSLGIDLDPDTVTLLQEVVEGQVRARLA